MLFFNRTFESQLPIKNLIFLLSLRFFKGFPYKFLSNIFISYPSFKSSTVKIDPIKPKPPIIRTFF